MSRSAVVASESGPALRGLPLRPEHVTVKVSEVLQKAPGARVIGVRLSGPWLGGESVMVGEQAHPVVVCTSALAVREALDRHEAAGDGPALLLLTPLAEEELGWDVLARLAKRRLLELAPWGIVRDLFRARDVDPRLTRHRWMAEVLLEHVPAGGYPPVPSGVLDADTAWGHVLGQRLGLRSGRPDAEAVLEASTDPALTARYEQQPAEARAALRERLAETAGRLGALLAGALEAGRGRSLLPIGLVAEVLFAGEAPAAGELARAAVRLEPYLGGVPIEPELGRRLFEAARRVLDRLAGAAGERAGFALQQAEELLRELRIDSLVGLSTVLPASYDRRLEEYGRTVIAALDGDPPVDRVAAALARVEEHREARREGEKERRGRLHMTLRLVRFLEARASAAETARRVLAAEVSAYVAEGSYVDWARTLLLGGEQNGSLAAAFERLSGRVREIREAENRSFAERLVEWNGSPTADVVGVERVLDAVVAPAAAQAPVLLLVLDGMSFASFRQLMQGVRGSGWEEWRPAAGQGTRAALAAVPCITRISRASLLSGRMSAGAVAEEARSFRQHPALVAKSRSNKPPLLFHKGDLATGAASGLSEDVREAIQDLEQRVVGVVLNALDDFLAKSDQVAPRWTLDRIRLLEPLLFEARLAGRVVVITSDHGHVLDADTIQLPGGEDERWRPAAGPVGDAEVEVSGPRVAAAAGAPGIVVPWSERVRYVRRKAGYHGGVTPQEMLVPVAVLAAWDRQVEGWHVATDQPPRWWTGDEEPETPAAVPVAEARPVRKSRAAADQASLFPEAAPVAATTRPADWITRLTDSAVFGAQRGIAGRMAPPDEVVRIVLEVLERHRGRAPRAAVTRAVGQPEIRIRGILAGLQRLLNVDGYPVLSVDETTETVELQRDLLRRQFQLDG